MARDSTSTTLQDIERGGAFWLKWEDRVEEKGLLTRLEIGSDSERK